MAAIVAAASAMRSRASKNRHQLQYLNREFRLFALTFNASVCERLDVASELLEVANYRHRFDREVKIGNLIDGRDSFGQYFNLKTKKQNAAYTSENLRVYAPCRAPALLFRVLRSRCRQSSKRR